MILTFGEIMLRLSTPNHLRYAQSIPGTLESCFGGGEAKVAVSLASLGNPVTFLTALPKDGLTEPCLTELRRWGVDTSHIHFSASGRLGIYFMETGSNQRPSVVLYDRSYSSISLTPAMDYDFDNALQNVTWVHTTGITPSLSKEAFESTLALVKAAADKNIPVSIDLNYRKKLWRWDNTKSQKELARACMTQILPYVNVVIANEEDASDVLGIEAENTSIDEGKIAARAYIDVARKISAQFASVEKVAITLRESISADHNNWGALLYNKASDEACFAPLNTDNEYTPYEIRDIIDRVGGGDSFGAGLIHALNTKELAKPQDAIRFAVAASALKHTIHGDFNLVKESEVLALMKGSGSGRVQR
jgi:2-dehydro-3-deoxygluconokinase